MTVPVIDVEQAVVAYGGRPVLRGVSMTVPPGAVVAILGANGSGKSTLVRSILRLVPLAGGSVRLFGTRLAAFRDWQRIGYVPQRIGAGSGVPATVGEVVAAGRLARRGFARVPGAGDRQSIADALAAVGLADRVDAPVSTLSGGQQQRTLIARALAGEPDLLVMDEPTAGVDAASQEAFARALTRFVQAGGAVLLVAHELGPLRPLITHSVVIHHGTVAHSGPVPEPAGYHAEPDHDHVHPHAPAEPHAVWSI